jgi:hypothetical protein
MEETLARFGPAAIEELNALRRPQREPTRNFVLLMAGLFILILLLYALIIWSQHLASPRIPTAALAGSSELERRPHVEVL